MMSNSAHISKEATIIRDWVLNYSDSMFTWALHKTSSKEIAEDLVQDTFMAAVGSFSKFEEKSNPKTWLFAILNNKINDHYRNNFRKPITNDINIIEKFFDRDGQWKPESMPQEWDDSNEHLLDNIEFKKTLEYCLKELPENWFTAIQSKYIEEKNGKLICQELNIAPTNFWQILHRAKLQLRKCLELNWFKK